MLFRPSRKGAVEMLDANGILKLLRIMHDPRRREMLIGRDVTIEWPEKRVFNRAEQEEVEDETNPDGSKRYYAADADLYRHHFVQGKVAHVSCEIPPFDPNMWTHITLVYLSIEHLEGRFLIEDRVSLIDLITTEARIELRIDDIGDTALKVRGIHD